MKEGDTIIYDFWFTNIGSENLIIKQAYPACGCTTPTYTQGEIKPGERGVIHIKFRSEGFGGTQVLKEIIVLNNGPERYARFKANVISLNPKEIIVDYNTPKKVKKKKKKKKNK